MAKAKKLIADNIKIIDIVIEILDARIPRSSRNNELLSLVKNKPVLVILNKSDLSDPVINEKWKRYYSEIGIKSLFTDSKMKSGVNNISDVLRGILKDKIENAARKGMKNYPVKAMIVGIPNVGKSSLINCLVKAKKAEVKDMPGVTRRKQWVSLAGNVDLLDMPGVLSSKIENKVTGENLAFTGAVKDEVLDRVLLSVRLIEALKKDYFENIINRYGITAGISEPPNDILEKIAVKRGMVKGGGLPDIERTAIMLADEFRAGRLGRISLEQPNMKD